MKFEKLYLSKWFYYVIIAIIFSTIFAVVARGAAAGNDFCLRFGPTFDSLILNFVIFIVFFDLREYLELKQSEKPLKARIGKQLYLVFDEVTSMLHFDIAQQSDGETSEEWVKRNNKLKLEKLVSNGITIAEDTWETAFVKIHERMIDNLIESFEKIEDRYSKQLHSNAHLRDSIITLEESLQSLKSHLNWGVNLSDMRKESTKDIEKIIEIISCLRKNGIDVGF